MLKRENTTQNSWNVSNIQGAILNSFKQDVNQYITKHFRKTKCLDTVDTIKVVQKFTLEWRKRGIADDIITEFMLDLFSQIGSHNGSNFSDFKMNYTIGNYQKSCYQENSIINARIEIVKDIISLLERSEDSSFLHQTH